MAKFVLTIEDHREENPEDDSYTCTVVAAPTEGDRKEENGLSQATIVGMNLYYLGNNPELIVEALKDTPIEDIINIPDQNFGLEV